LSLRKRNDFDTSPPRPLKPIFTDGPVSSARFPRQNFKDSRRRPGCGRADAGPDETFALRTRTRRGSHSAFGSLIPGIRHSGRKMRPACGVAAISALICGCSNAGNSSVPLPHALSGIHFVSQQICRGSASGGRGARAVRRRHVGKLAGTDLLRAAGEQPYHARDKGPDQDKHRRRDAVPRAVRVGNAAQFLYEGG
jgi:hypothetical protein